MTVLFAMDRAPSARRTDVDGRLHVQASHISKANVCTYYGREIPGWQALGLDALKPYKLLRHPDELAKAAPTFNNLPVLSEHVPVHAADHRPELVVGSTGTDATFDGQFLDNSLVVWAQGAIDGITANRKRQLSSAYRYRPDMTPGIYNGVAYDGVMRDIVGNHVALVIEGRAGPDVIVGDEQMKTRTALAVTAAVAALVRPKLAQDAKVDFSTVMDDVSHQSLAKDGAPAALAAQIVTLVSPHLAQDQALTADDVTAQIDVVRSLGLGPDDAMSVAAAPAPKVVGMDEATVQQRIDAAITKDRADAKAVRDAEREVFPYVGAVAAMDSAAAVYKLALDAAKVDLTGIDESAYGAMVRMLPKPGEKRTATTDVALDSAAADSFHKRFPNASTLVQS